MRTQKEQFFSTGTVCRLLGIRMHKFCYLEEAGVIPRAQRIAGSGERIFTKGDIERIKTVLAAAKPLKREPQGDK